MAGHSLKKQLLVSHNKISVLANLSLIVAALVAIPLYFNIQSLIKSDLPDAIEMNDVKHSVSQSNFLLNSWLLNGNAVSKQMRHEVWELNVDPVMAKIEKYESEFHQKNEKSNALINININLKKLEENQKKIERCLNCLSDKKSYVFRRLHEENVFITQKINVMLSDFIENRNKNIKNVLSIIAECLILFCMINIVCVILFNTYAFFIVRNTAEYYLSRLRKIIEATTFFSEGDAELLKPEGNDEIAQLMRDFNTMQEAIFSREAKLRLQRDDINELTRVVTHDMKPPIINIKGHAKIIAENGDALLLVNNDGKESVGNVNAVKKSIAYIEQSVSRLDELVSGILTYSKLSDKEIKLEKIQVLDVIKEILDVNQHRLKDSTVEVLEFFPEILFDRFVVKFIVSTIIDNAIAYQDENRPLMISIDYYENDDRHEILIKDNGVGMNKFQMDSLFKLSNKASGFGSSGIGLATAKTLLGRLKGDIVYRKNDNDIGSLFVIVLPR
jgi:signal transduction histidine kinase